MKVFNDLKTRGVHDVLIAVTDGLMCMKKAARTLRTRVGRVHRDMQRQLHTLPEVAKAKV